MNSLTCTIDESAVTEDFTRDPLVEDRLGLPTGSASAGIHPTVVRQRSDAAVNWFRDYVALTKPRILMMILITVGAGAVCVPSFQMYITNLLKLAGTLVGTMFVAASASILNQVMEKFSDAAMRRTRNRPLPAGRLTEFEASLFGFVANVVGLAVLALTTNGTATLVAFMTWLLYVGVYTPMKMTSVWNTAVGTLPGAMPVFIGWCGLGGSVADWRAWAIAGIVVLWQFPHFMSIAWLYKEDYANAGYKMWTTEDATGKVAGLHAWVGAALLIAVSVAAMWPVQGLNWLLLTICVVAGAQQLVAAVRFNQVRNDATARKLLRSSLLVLPLC